MRSRALLVVAAAAMAAGLGWPTSAAASGRHSATIHASAQAWYWTVGCTTPLGCGVIAPPVDPFPTGALHVGVVAGVQIASAYLGFSDKALPVGAAPSVETLRLPLATGAAAVNLNAGAAHLEVCTTDQLITSAEFVLSSPPPVNCTHSVLAVYHGGAKPFFTVNLIPLLGRGHSLAGRSLALLPASTSPLETWQIAFAIGSPASRSLITARVTYRVAAVASPVPSPAPSGVPAVTGPVADLPPVPVSGAEVEPAPSEVVPPVVVAQPPETSRAASARVIKGGRYGLVWAVPLALLLLGWFVGSTTTRDLRSLRAAKDL